MDTCNCSARYVLVWMDKKASPGNVTVDTMDLYYAVDFNIHQVSIRSATYRADRAASSDHARGIFLHLQ